MNKIFKQQKSEKMQHKSRSIPEHHKCSGFCTNRAAYRNGKALKAVKVYTVNLESKYLMVKNVPAINVITELVQLFSLCGYVVESRVINEYSNVDKFTECLLITFESVLTARIAKRKMDNFSFMGNVLHVFYAPEFETVDETREKLNRRRIDVTERLKLYDRQKNKRSIGQTNLSNRYKRKMNPEYALTNHVGQLESSAVVLNQTTEQSIGKVSKDFAQLADNEIEQALWQKRIFESKPYVGRSEPSFDVAMLTVSANIPKRKLSTNPESSALPSSDQQIVMKQHQHPKKRLKLVRH